MNNIEILEILSRKIEEQNSIIAACSSIINKKAEAKERTEYIEIKKFVENLIQENKELKEVLEKVSKDLDNIAYDQIPIEMQRSFGKEYDLGYRQGWYNAEEDWKLKVKEKIEWYKKYCDLDKSTLKVLQELLEGE